MISVTCPTCGTVSKTKDDLAGKMVKCPQCGERLKIPVQTVTEKTPIQPIVPPQPIAANAIRAPAMTLTKPKQNRKRLLIVTGTGAVLILASLSIWWFLRAAKEEKMNQLLREGQAHIDRREFIAAIETYRQMIELSPTDQRGYYRRARAYYFAGLQPYFNKTNFHNLAALDCEEAIRLDPSKAGQYSIRADLHKESDPEMAIADYSKAIALDPASSGAEHAERGMLQWKRGREDLAEMDFSRAVKQHPELGILLEQFKVSHKAREPRP